MITKYGYGTVTIIAFVSLILIISGILISNNIYKYFSIFAAVLLLGFTLYFFRDPKRDTPKNQNYFISPADGKIILVKDVFEDKFLKSEATQISIFMSPLDVHINRVPIDGKIDYLEYIHGKYLPAFNDKASIENERMEIGISHNGEKFLFTQVAGIVARRIICELKINDEVKQGEKFGMIKFGSRSDIFMPKNWKIEVKPGQQVYGGKTILFKKTNEVL
jgi:phosphatidylserine decarboxylase